MNAAVPVAHYNRQLPGHLQATRCSVPLPTPTSVATVRIPWPAPRCLLMAPLIAGDTLMATELLPLLAHTVEASMGRGSRH